MIVSRLLSPIALYFLLKLVYEDSKLFNSILSFWENVEKRVKAKTAMGITTSLLSVVIPWGWPCKVKAKPAVGITTSLRSVVIPWGWSCKVKAKPVPRVFLFWDLPYQSKLWTGCLKTKTTAKMAVVLLWLCGERGIRTPGPPIGGQRFSRPPHSTALPSLLLSV